MWKQLRILVLLSVLLVMSVNSCRDQIQNWDEPIVVRVHLINADAQPLTQQYINQLSVKDFAPAQRYLSNASAYYRQQAVQFNIEMGAILDQKPPKVPNDANVLQVMWWSLQFRYYAWRQRQQGPVSMTLFLNYYHPSTSRVLRHSTALQKGRIAVVNLFASENQASENQIVFVHELLHGFGATDKYNLSTGQPLYPQGYANPQQQPLYPQQYAEIMAIRRPVSAQHSEMTRTLAENVLSPLTAREIGW